MLPFPAQFLHRAQDEQTRKLAQSIWTDLNTLAQTDPVLYKQTIHETMAQMLTDTPDTLAHTVLYKQSIHETHTDQDTLHANEQSPPELQINLPGHEKVVLIEEFLQCGRGTHEEARRFISQCPRNGALRSLYQHGSSTKCTATFDLKATIKDGFTRYTAFENEHDQVLEFIPDAGYHLPYLSVRFFPLGAQLLVGPKVIYTVDEWLGGPLPDTIQVEFHASLGQLRIHVRV